MTYGLSRRRTDGAGAQATFQQEAGQALQHLHMHQDTEKKKQNTETKDPQKIAFLQAPSFCKKAGAAM